MGQRNINYLRGLKFFLNGFSNYQKDLLNFISRCKKHEDENGFIKQDFFDSNNFTRAKFVSGPFTNLVFDILSKQADKIEILIGKYKTTISKDSNFLYLF